MDVVERSQLTPERALAHWYYKAKFELLLHHVRKTGLLDAPEKRIADVGCGIGLFMSLLERTGHARPDQLVGIDPAYAQPATALESTAPILPTWPAQERVDLALLMDVLEHTPDDVAVLSEATSHVSDDGHIFITVPAFSWLFSAHDRFLGHYRRYSLETLRRTITTCGNLEILNLHYYYASILPVAVPWRLARRSRAAHPCSDLKELPGWLNGLLVAATRCELPMAEHNQVAGLTVVALCRKKREAGVTGRAEAPLSRAA